MTRGALLLDARPVAEALAPKVENAAERDAELEA
jgi:hypothetical protein